MARHGIVDSFSGYQAEDKGRGLSPGVCRWHALTQRDLRYSTSPPARRSPTAVNSQHVRMIDESINNAQANCVDGSVLLASVLRKIGIEPVLVMVPGHCYLGFQLDAEGKNCRPGNDPVGELPPRCDADRMRESGTSSTKSGQSRKSWKTFTAALAIGTADLAKNAGNSKRTRPDYQIISVIAAARKLGILPIASTTKSSHQAGEGRTAAEVETKE